MELRVTQTLNVKGWRILAYLGDISEYWDEESFVLNGKEYTNIEDLDKDYPTIVKRVTDYSDPRGWKKTLYLDIDIETGQVNNWPKNLPVSFYDVKLVDTGSYELVDEDDNEISKYQGYVPCCLGRGGYGDYLEFEITEDGRIKDWRFTQDDYDQDFADNDD